MVKENPCRTICVLRPLGTYANARKEIFEYLERKTRPDDGGIIPMDLGYFQKGAKGNGGKGGHGNGDLKCKNCGKDSKQVRILRPQWEEQKENNNNRTGRNNRGQQEEVTRVTARTCASAYSSTGADMHSSTIVSGAREAHIYAWGVFCDA